MPKKKKTPTPPPAKKPEILALKPQPPTPEPGGEVINDASTTPGAEVNPDAPAPTPGTEVNPDAKPSPEPPTPALTSKVDANATIESKAKPTRPVLRKKSVSDGEASPDAPRTPGLVDSPADDALFQAVGIILGDVTFDDDGKGKVSIEGKDISLFYASSHKQAFYALTQEVKNTGVSRQRLLVYPRITHFPKRDDPHRVSFQLVGFFRQGADKTPEDITTELNDMEFKLSGLWQFIPVCQTPCVSVFKNYTEERKEFIKEADVAIKVKYMKGSHVPVLWRDAPVRPFRFNPKLDKEQQGHAAFVQIKATFVPEKELFVFKELTSPPAAKPPRFLKAGKEDKATALKAKKEAKFGGDRKKS